MRTVLSHIKVFMFRGFLAIVPFALAIFAVRLLYVSIDQRVMAAIDKTIGFTFPGLGILLLLTSLYLLGLLASNFIGRQLLGLLDRATDRIPLIKSVYQIGKQLTSTFSLPERQVFKRALLVQYPREGTWVTGFLTGSLEDTASGETLLKIYVPMPPNPLSGLVLMVREAETRDPGWTVEEALKTVMSGGIIGPGTIAAPA